MKSKLYILCFSWISLAIISCKTASKLYEKGNYDEAVELAAKKLQKDPADAKLRAIIIDAYRYAVTNHESRIHTDGESTNELKWESIYNEYVSMQRMYDAIYRVPDVYNIIKPVDYSSYLITYSEKAGDVRFDRGLRFMQQYDKQSYRNAYREFQAALQLKPGNTSIVQKMDEAYDYAVTNVVVEPLQQDGGYLYSSYAIGGNNLDDELIRDLQYSSGNEFVKFYSSWDARSRQIRADQVVEMQLATVNIGRYHDSRTSRKVAKDIVIKETVYRPDSIVREYDKVYADITTTRRTMNSNALLQVTIRDGNGGFLWNDSFDGNHSWSTEFSSFTGDARALSETDKQQLDHKQESSPREEDIMRTMLDEINQDAVYSIKNYFSRF